MLDFFSVLRDTNFDLGDKLPCTCFTPEALGVKNSRKVKVTTHIDLVSSIRIRGDKLPLPHIPAEGGVRSVFTISNDCVFRGLL